MHSSPIAVFQTDNAPALVARLQAAIGTSNVLTEDSDLAPYLTEGRNLFKGSAVAAVRPGNTGEVAAIITIAREFGVPVVAQGGNTGLVGGGVPFGGIVLSLNRMNRILDIDAVNLTMTVEAGCVLQTIQEAAEAQDLLFPLSLGSEGSCTAGGNLATNAGGTAVLRYGNTRELALGLEVVMADGRTWNGLNRLRKDNTGYDLRNLFIGAEGTLGIITAAVLKLFPKPKSTATAWVGCRSAQDALVLFNRFRRGAGDTLTAFEFMPHLVLEFVLKHAADAVMPLGEAHARYALIELSSPDGTLDLGASMETLLGEAYEADLIQDATIAANESQAKALWYLRERMSDTQSKEGGSIKHDVSVPVSKVADFLDQASAACEAEMPGIRVVAFGHFGDGNIHFNLSQPIGMDKAAYLKKWEHFNRIVHDIVAGMGGSISAEHGIGLIKRDELALYKDPVALDIMRSIKQALDPDGLLNPGKVLPDKT